MPSFIQTKVLLAPYTTLGVGGSAEYFARVHTFEELKEVSFWAHEQKLHVTVLGGGSNACIADVGIQGVVVQLCISTIEYDAHNDTIVYVRAGAGVVFDTLVEACVQRGLWGLENLSAIPGHVGATPIQNIGAYGVEIKDVIYAVTAYDIQTGDIKEFTNEECRFGYRDSYFKTQEGKRYIVTHVTYVLSQYKKPTLHYKDLAERFKTNTDPTIDEIRKATIEIRKGKFPDWHHIGTAGSFFKNPVITKEKCTKLKQQYPDLPVYEHGENMKVSLGWILEHVCSLKGYVEGNIGLYEKQALVLVAKHGASAKEIHLFAHMIEKKVYERTGIVIEREVQFLS